MSSQCDECGGKCCKGILLPLPTGSVGHWLSLHGTTHRINEVEFVYVKAVCARLGQSGKCRDYEGRPDVCINYPVDGVACRWTRENVE